jgi:hypothetical protein
VLYFEEHPKSGTRQIAVYVFAKQESESALRSPVVAQPFLVVEAGGPIATD